ncbi:MAG TPA: TonB-dependent receptor [Bryobacteraceae bacterium]|nr:TonB-dependent receptor [Bryobacteraceae bacterium]
MHPRKLIQPALFSAAVALFVAQLCVAQTFSSSITGIVSDPTGALVRDAKIQLKNLANNDIRETMSGSNGSYQFENLLPGNYEIRAQTAGFKTYTQTNMVLRADTAATVNIPLQVGDVGQKVDVTGEAVLVDTESANNSVTMDSHLIESLPNNTRNPLNFVFSLAGTTEAQGGMTSRSQTFDQQFSMFGLNGGRSGDEQILIDGAPSTAMDWGGLMVSPVNDSVQEQQVASNIYDAQYERSGMGVVTLITKGGTNAFHGEAYDYLRNSALDANSWSNNEFDTPRGQFKRNQFGGNIGGPILKRYNLFFFGAYEGLRQPDTENSGLLTVPTQAERNGDFSQTLNSSGQLDIIYNPFSTTQVTDSQGNTYYTRTPFAGNKIPSNLISPIGQKIANLFPLPNRPSQGPNDLNNYYAQAPGNTTNDKFDWRVDWEQSAVHRLFVRMSDRVRENQAPACFFCNGADTSYSNDDNGFQVVINDTITPSPTWVIDTYIGYSRWHEQQTPVGLGKATAASIGLPDADFQAPVLPTIKIDQFIGGSGNSLGNGTYDRYIRYTETAQVNFTKQFSKHTVKFGANYDIFMINNEPEGVGNIDFNNQMTACDANTFGTGGPCQAQPFGSIYSGNGLATALLGTFTDATNNTEIDPAMSQHAYGAYIQDQWRVTPRLTINAGLRYENQRPATERYNRLDWFDPTVVNPISAQVGFNVLGGFEYASANNRYAWAPDNTNFAPRLGVAYKITDKLVARAGAGIFFTPTSAMISFDGGQFLNYGSYTQSFGTVNGQGIVPQGGVSNLFPNGFTPQLGNSQGLLTYVGLSPQQVWPKGSHPVGYTEQFSFDLQYQLSPHSIIEAGFTDVRGRKLMYGNPDINPNQLPAQDLALGSALFNSVPNPFYGVITDPNSSLTGPTVYRYQLLQPYPEFSAIEYTRSLPGASSEYNALDLKYNHAFSNGLSAIVTYRWSKALDDGSEDLVGWSIGNVWRDSYNTMLDYGPSTHDQPQSFAVAAVYDLPYGRGMQWGGSAPWAVRQVLGNWELSTNIRLASGLPIFGIVDDYDSPLNNAFGFPSPQVPDLVGNPIPSHQTPDQWFNPNAFLSTYGEYAIGNSPIKQAVLREAPTKNWDLSVAKSFGPERFRVQFRGEFLNVFNHPIFGGNYNFNECLTCGGTFGQVYGTRNDPRNIQFSLKAMF